MNSYLAALAITLALEVPVVAACFPGQRVRLAAACALTTTATHLFMHFGLPWLGLGPLGVVVVGEVLATTVEAGVYTAVSRPRSLGRGLVASALANSVSYAAGAALG